MKKNNRPISQGQQDLFFRVNVYPLMTNFEPAKVPVIKSAYS